MVRSTRDPTSRALPDVVREEGPPRLKDASKHQGELGYMCSSKGAEDISCDGDYVRGKAMGENEKKEEIKE